MSDNPDDKWDTPPELRERLVTTGQLTDLDCLPGEFKAFRVEMRDHLQSISRSLQLLVSIDNRLNVVIERQNDFEKRMKEISHDLIAETKAREALADRVSALEQPKRSRKGK